MFKGGTFWSSCNIFKLFVIDSLLPDFKLWNWGANPTELCPPQQSRGCVSLTAVVILHLPVQLGGPDESSLHHLHLHGLRLFLHAVELCLADERRKSVCVKHPGLTQITAH